MKRKIRISQCMIVKNEEKNIRRALSWAKDIVFEQIVVDTGNVAGFSPTVTMDIQQVPGLKNMFLGGEGVFNTLLTGPGKVWLQTMPISNVAMAIRPFIPTGNG